MIKKKLAAELIKYNLQLINLEPGILSVHVLEHREREDELLSLIKNIENDESVTKVERTGGNVIIYFNQVDLLKPATLVRWKEIFKNYI
ncbi:MAG: hypothetical protein FWF50_04105 [Defluviitaleaceae bacterium]|nr:hypothetical protein [Defluviitaleaceae bacterium]